MSTERVSRLPGLKTRTQRFATVFAMTGLVLGVGMSALDGNASAEPAPVVASDSASWGQAGSALSFGSTTMGCVAAPTPWTCGGAIGTGVSYFNNYGNEPLHGDPDMTQFGPMAAL